jgi:hypothetical protein
MRSVLEGDFQQPEQINEALTPATEPSASPVIELDAANQGVLVSDEPHLEQPEAVTFDVAELESQLERALPEKFKPNNYTEADGTDRIIIGFRNGEPIYKAEPKPARRKAPHPRPPAQASDRGEKRSSARPARRARSQSEADSRRQYQSTHALYERRHEQNPTEELGEYEEIDTFTQLNKLVTKATHLAAIATALLLILHYFPLPSS